MLTIRILLYEGFLWEALDEVFPPEQLEGRRDTANTTTAWRYSLGYCRRYGLYTGQRISHMLLHQRT